MTQAAVRSQPAVRVDRIIRPYWERIPQETRDAITAAVPPGQFIYIVPGHKAQPGTATVSLRTSSNSLINEGRGRRLAALCWWLLGAKPS